MGLSASQARFLSLTARKSDIEYQAQQIAQERLFLSDQMNAASLEYNDKISDRSLVFTYRDSSVHNVTLSYQNYKNYMNQQMVGLTSSQDQYFLVSNSGKIVVSNENEMMDIINSEKNTTYVDKTFVDAAIDAVNRYNNPTEGEEVEKPSDKQFEWAEYDWSSCTTTTKKDENGNEVEYYIQNQRFSMKDFMIAEDLDNVDVFQDAIRNGVYYFAAYEPNDEVESGYALKKYSWAELGGGAISDELDQANDAQAEAEYENKTKRLERIDKKLQMELDNLNSERDAIQTEMESVTKVMDDNIEKTFDAFS